MPPLRRPSLLLPLLAAALLAGACRDGTGSGPPPVPARLDVVGGDDQADTVGQELPQALVARVLDDDGDPIEGALVNFRVVSGGGSVFAGSALTDANGEARERWTLGTSTAAADSQRVEARAVDPATGAPLVFGVFSATALPGPADSVEIVPGAPRLLGVQDTSRLQAAARDQYGNPITGAAFAWTSSDTTVLTVDAAGLVTAVREGDATVTASLGGKSGGAPLSVVGGRAQLFSKYAHTCAVDAQGAARCWGWNRYGQLGTGSTSEAVTRPAPVSGGHRFRLLAPGYYHTCGVDEDAVAWCWGDNARGQLGTGSTSGAGVPVQVTGGLRFKQLVSGSFHTCGVTLSGAAWCWGDNFKGGLGTGAVVGFSAVPVAVQGGLAFRSLTAHGGLTCGVATAGAAYCWGDNTSGALGNGGTSQGSVPQPQAVVGGHTFARLSAGYSHVCGTTTAGATLCWGLDEWGAVGDGAPFQTQLAPVAVVGGTQLAGLASGGAHSCALAAGGAARCWGLNAWSQLGDGTATNRPAPVAVLGGLSFVSLAGGGNHTCGVTTAGEAWCWGHNQNGQLGDGTAEDEGTATPVRVLDLQL